MLGIFEKIAGPDTVIMVASTHGVRVSALPPGGVHGSPEAVSKSPYGILAAAGPGFAPDRLLHGAGILDVAPTILHWFGLPIGDDMEGRILLEGLSESSEVQRIETWEHVVPAFKSTGEPEPVTTPVAERLRMETRWSLAQSYLEAGRLEEALTQLHGLFQSFPERADICQALFQCQLNLGRLADAEQTLEVLLESLPSGPYALLPQAELAVAKRDVRQAQFLAAELRKAKLQNPMALRRLGMLLLHLRQWDALAELAQEALKREENDPIAWLGLAEALLRQKKPEESAEAALRAIQLKYFLPDAHFILARALVAQGKWVEAGETMSALLKLQPANRTAAGYDRRLKQRGQASAP
jgi:predicted Zn-dependent protease